MKFYKRFPGDIMKKTSGLTMAQFGAYDRLLDWCYANEKPVDPLETYTITHAQTPADRRDVDRVLSKFFTLEADGYHQERIEEVIAEALPRIQAARENGKKGGRPITQPEPSGLFSGTEDEPKPKAIQSQSSSPTSKNEEPTVLVGKQASRLPDCPTAELLALYHEHLPMLPRVEVVNDSRKRSLSARWREVIADPDIRKAEDLRAAGLDWFAWFFGHVSRSKFLTGKAKDWRADFDFLMTPSKFAKAIEGSYHKEAA